MAPILRKRPAASAPSEAAPQKKRPKSTKSRKAVSSAQKSSKRKVQSGDELSRVAEPQAENVPAFTYREPQNPQATLLGLPTELRLEIYGYLATSSMIHVHRYYHPSLRRHIFTWTPCKGTNPHNPLFCANPKWSGLCKETDRCTVKIRNQPEQRGFFGLAASCKGLRNEALDWFMGSMVVAIGTKDAGLWLDFVQEYAPSQLKHVRRFTLIGGPNKYNSFDKELVDIKKRIPNLEAIAFQAQESWRRWVPDYINPRVDHKWQDWHVVHNFSTFDRPITVAIEAYIYIKGCHYEGPGGWSSKEKQIVLRIVREGKEDGKEGGIKMDEQGWDRNSAEVQIEVVNPGGLVAKGKSAPWRAWWHKEWASMI